MENFTSVDRIPETVYGADRIIVVSQSLAIQVAHLDPVVIYNGVSLIENPSTSSRPASGRIVIGTACRLVPPKGLMDLLEAMILLRAEFPNIRLEIAGSGQQQADLEREVDRLNLTDHVQFLGWQSDLRSVLRTWDIFVLPSRNEGAPIAVLEAMSEGLPVVATNVGGLPELIEHGHSGFLIPPCDPLALARQLRVLVLEPELRQVQGAAGRSRVNKHFTVDRMVKQIQTVYADFNKPAVSPVGKLIQS
jgi:glycosyltransferase involved in cell wall biosynthesis